MTTTLVQPGVCRNYEANEAGTANEARKDLLNWYELNGLSQISSFKYIKERTTRHNRKWKKWYELDDYLVKQDQKRKVKEKTVIKEDSLSDLRPVAISFKYQVKGL